MTKKTAPKLTARRAAEIVRQALRKIKLDKARKE